MDAPVRSHELIVKIGADTADDLSRALEELARDVERGKLTTGCSGSPSVGYMYSYKHDPNMTHARYFADLDAYLESSRETPTPSAPTPSPDK